MHPSMLSLSNQPVHENKDQYVYSLRLAPNSGQFISCSAHVVGCHRSRKFSASMAPLPDHLKFIKRVVTLLTSALNGFCRSGKTDLFFLELMSKHF